MRKTYAKILSLTVILVMAMVCFTGCIRFRTTMSIKNNGTADLALIYAFHKDLMEESLQSDLDDTAEVFEDEGWTAEEYKKGDYRGYLFTMEKVNVRDFEEVFNSDAFETLDLGEFELTKNGSTYTINWDTNASDEVEEEGVSYSDLSTYGGFMEIVIELPSPAKEENATDVSNDGKVLTWNLFEEGEVEVTFSLLNVGLIIAIVASVVVVLAAGVVVVIVILLKKKSSERKAAPAESVAPAAPVSSPEPSSPIDFSAPLTPVVPVAPAEPAAPAAPSAPAEPVAPVAPAPAPAPVVPTEPAPAPAAPEQTPGS